LPDDPNRPDPAPEVHGTEKAGPTVDMVSAEPDETGKHPVVAVPHGEVQSRFQSGKWGFIKGRTLPVIHAETGEVSTIPVESAGEAFAPDSPYQLATPQEYRHATLESKHGGVVEGAKTVAEGFGRGLSVGLYDPAVIAAAKAIKGEKYAEELRQNMSERKEIGPWKAGLGEAAGLIAPALASGGAAEAGLAREALGVVGAPARAVGAAGRAAEGLAKGLVGEGSESLLARMAQSGVKHGLSAGAETALLSAGNEISEETLGDGDHKLNAEKIVAAAGHGAVTGMLLGAPLGAAGTLARAGVSKLAEVVSPAVKKLANTQAYRALRMPASVAKRLNEWGGGIEAAGETYLKHGVVSREARDIETMAERAESARDAVGKQLSDMYTGVPTHVTLEEALKPFHEAIARQEGLTLHSPVVEALDKAQIEFTKNITGKELAFIPSPREEIIPLKKLFDQRKAIGQLAFRGTATSTDNLLTKEFRQITHSLSELENKAVEELPESGITAKEAKALKREYQHLAAAEDGLKTEEARMQSRRIFGPFAKATGLMTATSAILSGHPLGAAAGVATAYGAKYMQEQGTALSAVMLDKLANLGAMSRTVAKVDGEISGSVNKFFRTAEERQVAKSKIPRVKPFTHKPQGEEYDQAVADTKAAQQPDPYHAATQMADLGRHAPNITTNVAAVATLATSFLASKIPNGNIDQKSLTPQLEKPRVSDFDKARFLRFKAAVDKGPLKLAEEIKSGHINRETVETVKAVYPESFKQIQREVSKQLAIAKEKPDYDSRIQLGILLGIPADSSQDRQFVQAQQSNFIKQPQQAPPPGKPTKGAKPKPMKTEQTVQSVALPLGQATGF
jgi:hypothetical protein